MNIAKSAVLFIAMLLFTRQAAAQGRFGIQVSPGMSFSKLQQKEYSATTALKFKGGIFYDWSVQEKHAISLGLAYTNKGLSWKKKPENTAQKHTVSSIELPCLFKLYTDEFWLGTKFYFSFGAIPGCKLGEAGSPAPSLEDGGGASKDEKKLFRRFHISLLLGGGIEYDLAEFTSVFGGISYQIGLHNIVKKDSTAPQITSLQNSLLSLDIGVRF